MNMPIEYMVDLHKFLYSSNDTDVTSLLDRVQNHIKYIPRKKLYRYRKSTNREIATLSKNTIWLSDPDSFPDVFDATIPIQDELAIETDYSFLFVAELAYKALVETAEEGEITPTKEVFMQAMFKTREKYASEYELENRLREIYGDEYEAVCELTRITPQFSKMIGNFSDRTIELMRNLRSLPRKTMCIASFSTDKDNRNMWENYANYYSGFCVEYNFGAARTEATFKTAWDILHLLPIRYYSKRPVFDHSRIIQSAVLEDTNQSDFYFDRDEYLFQNYRAVTSKLSDYRSEKEWRMVMPSKYRGLYAFPYISAIYLGKDMPENKTEKLMRVAEKLCVPIYLQRMAGHDDIFEYCRLNVD